MGGPAVQRDLVRWMEGETLPASFGDNIMLREDRAEDVVPLLVHSGYLSPVTVTQDGVAWKVTLTAELFGGGRGLGYVINVARQDYDTATIFAVILLIIAAVTLADRLIFAPLERLSTRQFGGAR